MKFGCRKCNRSFKKLQSLNLLKDGGDFWKCIDCNNDLTRDPKVRWKEAKESAKRLWNTMISADD